MSNLLKLLTESLSSPGVRSSLRNAAGVGVEIGGPSHLAAKQEVGTLLNKLLSQTNWPSQSSGAMFLGDVLGDTKRALGVPKWETGFGYRGNYEIPMSGALVSPANAASFYHEAVPVVVNKGKTLQVGKMIPAEMQQIDAIKNSMPYIPSEVPELIKFGRGVSKGKKYSTLNLWDVLRNEMYGPHTGADLAEQLSKAGFGSVAFKGGTAGLPADVLYLTNAARAKKVPMVMRDPKMTYDMIQELYPKLLHDPFGDLIP